MVSTKALGAIALTLVIACPLALGYVLSFDEEETTAWKTTDQFNISDYLLNSSTEYFQTYAGPNNNEVVSANYVTVGSNVTSTPIYEEIPNSITVGTGYTLVPDYAKYSLFFSSRAVQYKITLKDSTVVEGGIAASGSGSISKDLNNNVHVKVWAPGQAYVQTDETYSMVQKVELKASSAFTQTYNVWMANGTYANASDGWVPTGERTDWSNAFNNDSVTFSVNFLEASNLRIWGRAAVLTGIDGDPVPLLLTYSGSTLSYGPDSSHMTALGNYSKVRVTVTPEKFLIDGLQAWAALGASATTYNHAELDHAAMQDLKTIYFDWTNNHNVVVRCDSAEIPAGSYPSTKDCTLDLAELFPDTMMSLRLNSVGVYGDSLDIGGMDFAVENGRITVDGRPVSLKGAMISFLPDDDGWLVGTIGGRELGHFAELPSITFGGEWSLTATAYKVEETTGTSTEWQPGGFGLDKDGLIAAGLLTACGVFVMLGMYGRASGTKVGLLAVICGGAAIVYFMLI